MVKLETEKCEILFEVVYEVVEELVRIQKDQRCMTNWMEFTCEGMVSASKEFTNCWVLHNVACANVNYTNAKLSDTLREVSNRRAIPKATCAEVKKGGQKDR